jgi:predicted Zn-dependent peptidase
MYQKTVLNNGVTIATETIPNTHSLALAIWPKVGSRDEAEEEQGLCHLLEHMVFKGKKQRSAHEIARELDAIGGISDAVTSKEAVSFYVKLLPKHLPRASDIMLEILKEPRFDPNDLELEKQVVFQEFNMIEDTPEDYVYELLSKALFGDHPLGRPIIGTKECLNAASREQLLGFWDKHLHGANILVSASGKISHEELLDAIGPGLETFRGNGARPPRERPPVSSGREFLERDLAQVHVTLGYEAPPLASAMRMPCAILNCILGGNMSSRLFQRVREREGLVYSIYSSYYPYSDTGIFSVYFATEREQVNQVVEMVKEEVQDLMVRGPSTEELNHAKEYSIAGIYLGTETPESRMFRNAKSEIHLGRYIPLEEIERMIQEVSCQGVKEAAYHIFGQRPPALAVIGPIHEHELHFPF